MCNQFGIVNKSTEKPGAHLPYSHPSLEAVRTHVKTLVHQKKIHERLIANFDQVWSLRFRPNRKSLMKESSLRGVVKDPLIKSALMRKIRHCLERSLDLPFSETDPSGRGPHELRAPRVTGGAAASAFVDEEWRVPRTVCTLSFSDGHIGRSYITVREGTMSEDVRGKLNTELSRYLFIDQPQPRSHVWTQETFVSYLSFLAEETRLFIYRLCVNPKQVQANWVNKKG